MNSSPCLCVFVTLFSSAPSNNQERGRGSKKRQNVLITDKGANVIWYFIRNRCVYIPITYTVEYCMTEHRVRLKNWICTQITDVTACDYRRWKPRGWSHLKSLRGERGRVLLIWLVAYVCMVFFLSFLSPRLIGLFFFIFKWLESALFKALWGFLSHLSSTFSVVYFHMK